MENKSKMPFQLFGACLLGLILGKFFFSTSKDKVELSLFNGKTSKIQAVMNIIENRYVDILDIDSLTELAIPELLSHLDPHSSYTPARNLNEAEKKINGQFCGVGIEYNIFNDTIQILYTHPDGPARKAGLRPGDKIIQVDTINAVGKPQNYNLALDAISGELKTKVLIKVERMGCDSIIPYIIERNYVKVKSVTAAYMIDSTTGYIKIESFGENAYREFTNQLKKIQKQNAKNLIIDIRNNGGGRVNQVNQIASELLPSGDTIAFTINRNQDIEDILIDTTQKALCNKMKIVCMVNSNSASASEILAGALQDNDRGIILGRRTFGKGLVQTPIQLTDGSLVRLTTERYYTPSGRSLQKGYDDYKNDLYHRIANGELDSASAYRAKDSTIFKTKNGRVVYSKGGITPDIFVPENWKTYSRAMHRIDSASIFHRYATLRYCKIPQNDSAAAEMYIMQLTLNKANTIEDMISFAKTQNISASDYKFILENRELIYAKMLAYAYHIVDNEDEYYRNDNFGDLDISEAIKAVNNNESFNAILNIN